MFDSMNGLIKTSFLLIVLSSLYFGKINPGKFLSTSKLKIIEMKGA